jgi:hypothetical protein
MFKEFEGKRTLYIYISCPSAGVVLTPKIRKNIYFI